MTTVRRLVGATLLSLALVGWTVAGEPRTFRGHWEWAATGDSGSLEAVFTPTGEGTWDVSFHFNFQGPHVFSGTAEGSLDDGKLTGTVIDEDDERSFSFRGMFRNGKLRGTHFEVTGGSRRRTGTLSLRS